LSSATRPAATSGGHGVGIGTQTVSATSGSSPKRTSASTSRSRGTRTTTFPSLSGSVGALKITSTELLSEWLGRTDGPQPLGRDTEAGEPTGPGRVGDA